MTVSFRINTMTKLLEKISTYQLTQGKTENLTGPIIIIRNWVSVGREEGGGFRMGNTCILIK